MAWGDRIVFSSQSAFTDAMTGEQISAYGIGDGKWRYDHGGSTHSADTGPGTNTGFGYMYTETSSGSSTTVADMENNGTCELADVPTDEGRTLHIRCCIQGDLTDATEGLAIQHRASETDTWGTAGLIRGWAYSDDYETGDTLTDHGGVLRTVSADGGWVDFAIAIPDTATEIRLRPQYVLNEDQQYQHDIAVRWVQWHWRSLDVPEVFLSAADIVEQTSTTLAVTLGEGSYDIVTYAWASIDDGYLSAPVEVISDEVLGPFTITSDDTTIWVSDEYASAGYQDELGEDIFEHTVRAFSLATGLRDSSKDITWEDDYSGGGSLDVPFAMFKSGIYMWMALYAGSAIEIRRYNTSTSAFDQTLEMSGDNTDCYAIYVDGINVWVVDYDAIYAYEIATGDQDETKTITMSSDMNYPVGAWGNNAYIWVLDQGNELKVYCYALSDGARQEDQEVTFSGRTGTISTFYGFARAHGLWWVFTYHSESWINAAGVYLQGYDVGTGRRGALSGTRTYTAPSLDTNAAKTVRIIVTFYGDDVDAPAGEWERVTQDVSFTVTDAGEVNYPSPLA